MKLRRIAAALVIVSLGAAGFTFAAVRGQMADCRITEKTIVGDAAAAAGLTASFGMGLQNQLYWKNVYTYGGADDGADVQETTFSRKNPFPADKKAPVPSVLLTGYMTTSSTLDFLLTDPAEGDPTRQELLEQVWYVTVQAMKPAALRPAEDSCAEAARAMRKALGQKRLAQLAQLLRRYAGECRFNVGVGHVLGALAASCEQIFPPVR